jgi:hypothetical protein
VDHEIELSESIIGLEQELEREKKWTEIRRRMTNRNYTNVSQDNQKLTKELQFARVAVANRDDMLQIKDREIRDLRGQVGDRDREISELKRVHGLD